jgi:hypothetical protein
VSAPEIQGWYYQTATSNAVRVRLSVVDRSLVLHTLSDRLIARWSLEELQNREITVLGERWSIGDRRVAASYLVLESDNDYRAIRAASPKLRPVRARLWRQLGLAAIESGNRTGWAVLLLLIVLAGAILGLWQLS